MNSSTMPKNDYILGLTSIENYAHDNSVTILRKGKILFAASEERFSRIKHDGSFPIKAIQGSLSFLNLKPSQIGLIAVGFPKRRIFSILENKYFYEFIPFVLNIFKNRNLFIIKDSFKLLKLLHDKSKITTNEILKNKKIIYIDHHLAHSASAYYTSGFKNCISIVLDAFGSNEQGKIRSGAVYLCDQGEMKEISSIPIYSSLGNFYQSVTYSLGFTPGDGEGKTMGLAAYGKSQKIYSLLKPFSPTFKNGVWLSSKDWLSGMILTIPKISALFNSSKFGNFLNDLLNHYKKEDLAAAAQKILEEELVNLVKYYIKKYPEYGNICLSGGVFLNVKANKKIMEIPGIKEIFIQPNAGDGGVAMGAAFMTTEKKYLEKAINQPLVSCGLGISYTNREILRALKQYGDEITFQKKYDIVYYTVEQLLLGKVIGWFQGRGEWGPRALGFRSVLADPRKIEVKNRINDVLKNREWFMPFAPSILEEEGKKFFANFRKSPFMTLVFNLLDEKGRMIPAAIHIDDTARINSVNSLNNPIYYRLLKTWFKKTGLPIILNTSFNKHGLPIVNSPQDTIDHLLMGAVDELIIGDFAVSKRI